MTDYEQGLKFVLIWEGGYSNHPNDNGGATNKGITQSTYNNYRLKKGLPEQSVKLLTDTELKYIYYNNYWLAAHCDKIPFPLNIAVFDCAVNSGPARAIKLLQRILALDDDGIVGPKTLKAIDSIQDSKGALEDYIDQRESFYRDIVARKPNQSVFLRGWLNRIDSLRRFI